MKLFFFCLIIIVVGGSVLAYKRNPVACQKLGNDLKADWPKIQGDVSSLVSNLRGQEAPAGNPSNGDGELPDKPATPKLPPSFTETTDYNQALSEAKRTGRRVLVHFTGSSWGCPTCLALDQEVIANPSYTQFAQANFITVNIDLPHDITANSNNLPPNIALASKYRVSGVPTIVIITPDEKELARMVGYSPGTGVQAVIDHFQPYAD